jgi:RimJ/RimL family protein N-acetyltransferase
MIHALKSDNRVMTEKSAVFDLQPTLKGKLLELRPLRADDEPDLYAVASDPLIWEQHPAKERCTQEGFREFFQKTLNSGGALLATDRKDGRVIGSSRYHRYDPEQSEIEVGWTFLARSRWGGVYNGEMKELMLRHAFQFVDRVVFLVAPENLRSQKAVEKIGGVRMGWRRNTDGNESFCYQITEAQLNEALGKREQD